MRVGGNWDNTVETNLEFRSATTNVQTCETSSANATCCCPHSFYPWIKKPYYEPTMEGLNEQIEHFVEWVQPTEEERLMRADVCHRIEKIVKNIWPNSIIETIGSTCTDLCVPTSDIDMVIFGVACRQKSVGDGSLDPNAFTIECLYKLAKNLEDIAQRNSIEVLDTAKVPIIKMRDRKSGIEVDISFGVTSGKENSKVVMEYCKKYPLVKPLTLVIKYYLKQKFLNNSWSGGIGSYTLLHAQKREPSNTTLADHLLGFFALYGSQFNYVESVISIVNEGRYLSKSDKNWKNENYPSLLSVEDPHNPDNDIGCISFKIENAKEAFFQAYNLLAECKSVNPSASNKEESKKSSDFSCSQPDLNVSQLLWVNYSLQCFRARIKSIYQNSSDGTEMTICPIHPTNKMHSSLNLSSTRFFNNGTKPHKHKNYGSNKDAKRLSKKTNKKNYISLNMDGNLLNTGMNSWRESDSNLKTNRHDKFYKVVNNEYPSLAKNTLHRGASYVNGVDSPAQ